MLLLEKAIFYNKFVTCFVAYTIMTLFRVDIWDIIIDSYTEQNIPLYHTLHPKNYTQIRGLVCFVLVMCRSILPTGWITSLVLGQWYGYPMPVKQPWRMWFNESHGSNRNWYYNHNKTIDNIILCIAYGLHSIYIPIYTCFYLLNTALCVRTNFKIVQQILSTTTPN